MPLDAIGDVCLFKGAFMTWLAECVYVNVHAFKQVCEVIVG